MIHSCRSLERSMRPFLDHRNIAVENTVAQDGGNACVLGVDEAAVLPEGLADVENPRLAPVDKVRAGTHDFAVGPFARFAVVTPRIGVAAQPSRGKE